MTSPTPLSISANGMTLARSKFKDGFGLFADGPFTFALLDGTRHQINVLRRTNDLQFTALIKAQPKTARVAINGQIFGPSGLYSRAATGVLDPDQVVGEGSIHESGVVYPEDATLGEARYFFGRTVDGDRYRCQIGNPTPEIYEGMGGLGPLIITNPATGVALPAGDSNRYASSGDAASSVIPKTDEDWRACTQRKSLHFISVDSLDPAAFCALGANTAERLLIFVVCPQPAAGRITELRDRLLDAGFDAAAFTDGSNSSCFAVDGEILVEPHFLKDRLIEAGFVSAPRHAPKDLRVTLKTLEILDIAVVDGDEGQWRLEGIVAGSEFGHWPRARFAVDETLALNWTADVRVDAGKAPELRLRVENLTAETMTGIPAPEVTDFVTSLSADVDPPFGIGDWVVTNRDGFYRLRYSVEAR